MSNNNHWTKWMLRIVSYVMVAVLASIATLFFAAEAPSKLTQLEALISQRFIGEVDNTAIEDAAADAMVQALGDPWSYYIPADEYAAYEERKENAYVGVGMTVAVRQDGMGLDIQKVEPGGSAKEQGVLPGDILVAVEGQKVADLGIDGTKDLIRGEADTQVSLTVLRNGLELNFTLTRQKLRNPVAVGTMLDGKIGLVTIANFNENCFSESKAAVEALLEQGAEKLIFDVRNNPGGYKSELVKLLDYLLPEGPLFRSLYYTGQEDLDTSDETCLQLPMAVLINGSSYSAAEFFAAALEEYDWAVVVGTPTSGKSYFQNTYEMTDGSAVGLSVGKYFTPNGVSLAEEGGLVPQVLIEVDEQTAALIYADALEPAEDPQIQAAVKALQEAQ